MTESPDADPSGSTEEPRSDGTTTTATPGTSVVTSEPSSRTHRRRRPSSSGSFWRELPVLIVIALVLALLIKTFLVQAFYIPSASMENTLQGGNPDGIGTSHAHPNDRVLVNKLVYDFRDPHRGEVIVFSRPPHWDNPNPYVASSDPVVRFFHDVATTIGLAPSTSSDFVKRVIGVAGDTVSCKNDVLSVNGKVLNEPFLYPGSQPCAGGGGTSVNFDNKSVQVPKGQLFVMGDHRDDSEDSRYQGNDAPYSGFVPVSDVVGRAFVVIWPARDWKTLPVPSTFKQPGLSAASSPLAPVGGAAAVVLPIAGMRFRRRRRRNLVSASSYASVDG